jgi:dTDP-4-amino-4,6-dideoxygalactose transaminase/RimJ/RimL family protein N-acetyltransferase
MDLLRRAPLLTAGPSITGVEINNVLDAVRYGWNSQHSRYVQEFEQAFSRYVGVKHAMCTSSCTGALHLTLAGLGIGTGDEVLVPEISWVASGFSPTYVGARPVFVDVEPDTWCMSPKSIERCITPRTKAIMVVHLYGHPCDMEAIDAIAEAHKLVVIEDAAPSMGSQYRGRKTGSLAKAGCFSFQGAKIMVSGEGGMFCTDDTALFDRVRYLNDYNTSKGRSFFVEKIGYKFRMSNLQAALGLAQLSRLDELVAQKRQIFHWYKERLGDLPQIRLNAERPKTFNNFWMPSLCLSDDLDLTSDDFRQKLKERYVDTRPFFYPMSSLPMFDDQPTANPEAYRLHRRGVNLPGGHNLNEDDIDHVASTIRHALGIRAPEPRAKAPPKTPFGIFCQLKNGRAEAEHLLPIEAMPGAHLRPLTYDTLQDEAAIRLLSQWRRQAAAAYLHRGVVTDEKTRGWLESKVLDAKDRLLFWVENAQGERIGHVGLNRLALDFRMCELDNIVRGMPTDPSFMAHSILALLHWQRHTLGVPDSYLRVFSDNARALRLYTRLGYSEILRVPLLRRVTDEAEIFEEVIASPYVSAAAYFVTMKQQVSVPA